MVTESGGDEMATRPGMRPAVPGTRSATRRRRRLVTNETATTGGVMYTDEGELDFDEDEMAALEGQHLVADLFPNSRSEPDFEGFHVSVPAGNLSGCQQTVQLPPVPKPIQLKQTISPKTAKKCFRGNYITTKYFVLCIVCCVVYCLLCITVLCCANNEMQLFSTKFIYFS